MAANRSYGIHHFIKTAILLGFSTYIVHLAQTGNLMYYIAPKMADYVKWSSVALYAIAVHQFYLGLTAFQGARASCDCGHEHAANKGWRGYAAYALLLFPLLLGIFVPDAAMGGAMAEKKGINLGASSSLAKYEKTEAQPAPAAIPPAVAEVTDEQLKAMFASPNRYSEEMSQVGMILYRKDVIEAKPEIFTEILTAIDLFKNNFYGKKIKISGFVHREKDLKPSQFIVGRFAVSCCTADAVPYGVMAEFQDASKFGEDEWVEATGTIEKGSYQGSEIIKIKIEKAEKIAAPDSPYVYQNPEPLKALEN